MIAPGEGPAAKIATGDDNVPSHNAPVREAGSRIVGHAEPWQVRTLMLLQQRAREAQDDLQRAVAEFAPEPGCSLVNGQWVRRDHPTA